NQSDILAGYAGADAIFGMGGDDRILPGFGAFGKADYIDGGSGLDAAILVGSSANYAVQLQQNGDFYVTTLGTSTGVLLHDVERISFSDKTIALDTAGTAGMAYRLYQAAFDRTPDQAGLSYW